MIQITAQMRVLVAIEPVDGRKGIDSLERLCQEKFTVLVCSSGPSPNPYRTTSAGSSIFTEGRGSNGSRAAAGSNSRGSSRATW